MSDGHHEILMRKDIKVRWGDMDALGHVNNTCFLRYVEEIRLDWFDSFDGEWSNDSMGPVVAGITINFRKPIVWPATLAVDLCAQWSGGKSMTLTHEIRDANELGRLYADATVVCVWVDHSSGCTRGLPGAVMTALGHTH